MAPPESNPTALSPHPGGSASSAAPAKALGTSVSADLEALKNDVEQARELACEYQRQLAGKSNDHALLKSLFEKTRNDLVQLHQGIAQLREERHRFANDAMKAMALEVKLERVTRERDQLQNEADALRKIRAGEGDERVAQLTRELERLRRELRINEPAADSFSPVTNGSKSSEAPVVGFADDWSDDGVTIVPTDPTNTARKWRRR